MFKTAVILAAFVLVVVHYLFKFWRIWRHLIWVPGPPGYYLIGNILEIYGDPGNKSLLSVVCFITLLQLILAEIFKNLRRVALKYKQAYRLWFGYVGCICFTNPEDIEVTLP